MRKEWYKTNSSESAELLEKLEQMNQAELDAMCASDG
jgi:hypothetical protein